MNDEQLKKGNELAAKIKEYEDHVSDVKKIGLHESAALKIKNKNYGDGVKLDPRFVPMPLDLFVKVYIALVEVQIEKFKSEYNEI